MLVKMAVVLVKIAVMMMAPGSVPAPPEARGRTSPPLSQWRRSAIERGIIATVIVFINITILISFTWSTLPHPTVIPYLNMVLYATYYDPMMCCHPMMF